MITTIKLFKESMSQDSTFTIFESYASRNINGEGELYHCNSTDELSALKHILLQKYDSEEVNDMIDNIEEIIDNDDYIEYIMNDDVFYLVAPGELDFSEMQSYAFPDLDLDDEMF